MDAISERLERAGWRVSITDKAPYYEGMLRLLGGVAGLKWLYDAAQMRLFTQAQVRKRRAYTYRELQQLSDDYSERFEARLRRGLERHIWLRGYRLRCPACALERWYPTQALSDPVVCQGCYTPFIAPLRLPFAYRLNPLFAEGLKQGALTVLLALYYGYRQWEGMQWRFGLLLRDGQQVDIDLLLQAGERLYLVECKDKVRNVWTCVAQVQRGLAAARRLRGAVYVFATLQTPPPLLAEMEIPLWTAEQLLP